WGGRRFLLAVGSGVATTALQWFGKLDPQGMAYGITIGATVAAYITGNVQENKHNVQAGIQNAPTP
ncbi:MAG: hypothetical protein HXX19_06785, partial [Rhodoferax sp.]|nr:hypothetical protein [Rhodoferax sp.]